MSVEMKAIKNNRKSNIELFRIVLMILLVASHYVHNSGILEQIYQRGFPIEKSIIIAIFGMWGKPVINCFIFITGYFMCKKTISIRKWFRLLLEVLFYNIVIYLVFLVTGYRDFSFEELIYDFLPIKSVWTDFVSCYLIFYLLIPFVNILINNMNQTSHFRLLCLLGGMYIILGTIPKITVMMNYVSWFTFAYLLVAYFRIYKNEWTKKKKIWLVIFWGSYLLSILSIIVGLYVSRIVNMRLAYYLLEDSNKILAVVLSLSLFMLFLNFNIKQSKIINNVAKSTFGVLLIHANSDIMRKFLWVDLLKCTYYFNTEIFLIHAVLSVSAVYFACVFIDRIRFKFIDEPIFNMIMRYRRKK